MRAIWLSTRNDALLSLLTVAAAGFIAIMHTAWPDIVAGALIASVNLWGSAGVIRTATAEMLASVSA